VWGRGSSCSNAEEAGWELELVYGLAPGDVRDLAAFAEDAADGVAAALRVGRAALRPLPAASDAARGKGMVTVRLGLAAGARDAAGNGGAAIAGRLEAQARDPGSALLRGRHALGLVAVTARPARQRRRPGSGRQGGSLRSHGGGGDAEGGSEEDGPAPAQRRSEEEVGLPSSSLDSAVT
jgi:hypothetical protein